jgi:hypothetical protein
MRVALLLALTSTAAFAGRSKMIEIKSVPKSIPALADALKKESKDVNRRAAMSLVLDDLLRAKPEVTDATVYDNIATAFINDVLDKMCEPTDAFSTEFGADKFNPRADLFFRQEVKLRPGRVTKDFRRRYTKKAQGANIDRGYRNQPLTVDFVAAVSDAEFEAWVETKSWGVVVHKAHVDPATSVARIGLTFISNGTKDAPGGRFERPSWVGFYKQVKPGVGSYQPLSIERVTATDWREQPINVVPPKVEPNELSKKLYLDVWMEQVRAIPVRAAFRPQEEALFKLELESPDKIEQAQIPWLEKYRDSDSPMVRAAAELKVAALGGEWKPDNVFIINRTMKHPVVKAKLEEQLKKAPEGWTPPNLPPLPPEPAAAPDAGKPAAVDAGKPAAVTADAGR